MREHIGLEGSVLGIFESYLQGRSQCISIENVLSNLSNLIFGVPQGSILGPIIFCIYTLPLGAILRHHNIPYHIYADDTQRYCACDADSSPTTMSRIEACITDIRSWMITNKLKINDEKTEFLIISSPRSSVQLDLNVTIGQSVISPSNSCRNLGVMFDRHVKMNVQISSMCRSIHFHLRNIGSIRSVLTDDALAQLVHALVTSRLDYCNALLYGLPDTQLGRLQRMQNIACRIVSRQPKTRHVSPLMKKLHWLPVDQRIIYKILLLTYKALNDLAPEYLRELVIPYCPVRNLRSADLLELEVPKTRLKTNGDRSFKAAAAKEWNKLSLPIKMSPSLPTFKASIKTYLFKSAYK